jgi:hypothetical protein
MVPLALETLGTAGRPFLELAAVLKRLYGTRVLPQNNPSVVSTFHSAWAHRVSTILQRGTAAMIHVTRGMAAPVAWGCATEDVQVLQVLANDIQIPARPKVAKGAWMSRAAYTGA